MNVDEEKMDLAAESQAPYLTMSLKQAQIYVSFLKQRDELTLNDMSQLMRTTGSTVSTLLSGTYKFHAENWLPQLRTVAYQLDEKFVTTLKTFLQTSGVTLPKLLATMSPFVTGDVPPVGTTQMEIIEDVSIGDRPQVQRGRKRKGAPPKPVSPVSKLSKTPAPASGSGAETSPKRARVVVDIAPMPVPLTVELLQQLLRLDPALSWGVRMYVSRLLRLAASSLECAFVPPANDTEMDVDVGTSVGKRSVSGLPDAAASSAAAPSASAFVPSDRESYRATAIRELSDTAATGELAKHLLGLWGRSQTVLVNRLKLSNSTVSLLLRDKWNTPSSVKMFEGLRDWIVDMDEELCTALYETAHARGWTLPHLAAQLKQLVENTVHEAHEEAKVSNNQRLSKALATFTWSAAVLEEFLHMRVTLANNSAGGSTCPLLVRRVLEPALIGWLLEHGVYGKAKQAAQSKPSRSTSVAEHPATSASGKRSRVAAVNARSRIQAATAEEAAVGSDGEALLDADRSASAAKDASAGASTDVPRRGGRKRARSSRNGKAEVKSDSEFEAPSDEDEPITEEDQDASSGATSPEVVELEPSGEATLVAEPRVKRRTAAATSTRRSKTDSRAILTKSSAATKQAANARYQSDTQLLASLYSRAERMSNVFHHPFFAPTIEETQSCLLSPASGAEVKDGIADVRVVSGHQNTVLRVLDGHTNLSTTVSVPALFAATPQPRSATTPVSAAALNGPTAANSNGEPLSHEWFINAGGPITALDWAPVGDSHHAPQQCEQYLAVATSAHRYRFSNARYADGHVIQLWRVPLFGAAQPPSHGSKGRKGNSAKPAPVSESVPELAFTFLHKYGVVHDLRWFPYGVWQPVSHSTTHGSVPSRLGVLAVASGDGAVYLYCVPHPPSKNQQKGSETPTSRASTVPQVALQPRAVLSCPRTAFYRLRWARHADQRLLAMSIDGAAAVWDFTSILSQLDSKRTRKSPVSTSGFDSLSVSSPTAGMTNSGTVLRPIEVSNGVPQSVSRVSSIEFAIEPLRPTPLFFCRVHIEPSSHISPAFLCVRDGDFHPADRDIFVTVGDDFMLRTWDLRDPVEPYATAPITSQSRIGAVCGCFWIPGTTWVLCATELYGYRLVDYRGVTTSVPWAAANALPEPDPSVSALSHLRSAVPLCLDGLVPLQATSSGNAANGTVSFQSYGYRLALASGNSNGALYLFLNSAHGMTSDGTSGSMRPMYLTRIDHSQADSVATVREAENGTRPVVVYTSRVQAVSNDSSAGRKDTKKKLRGEPTTASSKKKLPATNAFSSHTLKELAINDMVSVEVARWHPLLSSPCILASGGLSGIVHIQRLNDL